MAIHPDQLCGVLLDLSGVLHVGDQALPGAVEALKKLKSSGLAVRYVTNTSRQPRDALVARLKALGFAIETEAVFTPAQIAVHYLKTHGLRPWFLVHPALRGEFPMEDAAEADAVVLGDAGEAFTYARLNQAFRLLMRGATLLALGDNRYFQDRDGLSLDIGPFKAALEYASGTQAVVLGKPAPTLFLTAAAALGCDPGNVLMVGDDAVADVEGALRAGLRAVLVRTGKYRAGDEDRIGLPGAEVMDDLAAVVDWLLQGRAAD